MSYERICSIHTNALKGILAADVRSGAKAILMLVNEAYTDSIASKIFI